MLGILKDKGGEDGESVYRVTFERRFLEESEAFYVREADELLTQGTATEYAAKAERRLYEEDSRVHHYLQPSTGLELLPRLEKVLITDRLSAVFGHSDGGLASLIDQDKRDDLARLYRLSRRVPDGAQLFRRAIKDWVITRGQSLADNTAADTPVVAEEADADVGKGKGKEKEREPAAAGIASALTWVQGSLDLKDKMDRLLANAWEGDLSFQTSINEVSIYMMWL